jgi:hypothetical protein
MLDADFLCSHYERWFIAVHNTLMFMCLLLHLSGQVCCGNHIHYLFVHTLLQQKVICLVLNILPVKSFRQALVRAYVSLMLKYLQIKVWVNLTLINLPM